MSSIELIRAEVEHERKLHHGCTGCRTMRLAEDKLKLAEAVELVWRMLHYQHADRAQMREELQRVLAEVAHESQE